MKWLLLIKFKISISIAHFSKKQESDRVNWLKILKYCKLISHDVISLLLMLYIRNKIANIVVLISQNVIYIKDRHIE